MAVPLDHDPDAPGSCHPRQEPATPTSVLVAGLDLGQVSDFTALAVDEQTKTTDVRHKDQHAIRHLRRWPLKTAYPQIVADVKEAFAKPPLAGCPLVVDGTGVGVAVVDLFRQAKINARLIPVSITGGAATGVKGGWWTVPKRELAGVLQVVLGERRMQFADVPLADTVKKELTTFKVKVNIATGTESFEAWREKDHDDLVLAVALACWWHERGGRRLSIFA